MTNFISGIDDRDRWPKAILFDLDGTLIDSAPDIAAATNELLGRSGLPALSVDAVRGMIGDGVEKLVERSFSAAGCTLNTESLLQQTAAMMDIYSRHLTNQTTFLLGAAEIVFTYFRAGVKVAVVSNKPKPFTDEILGYYGFSSHLTAAQGAEDGLARKPAPDMLFAILARIGVRPEEALFVGDSKADVDAARAAGMPVILVRGGYSRDPLESLGADGICDSLNLLPQALEVLMATR